MREPQNQAWQVSNFRKLLLALFCFAGGMLYAAALPPFNLWYLAAVCLLPLLHAVPRCRFFPAVFCGWLWGMGWALFAFQFLREIEWFVPYLTAPVLALWPALFAGSYHILSRNTLLMEGTLPQKQQTFKRVLLLLAGAAALFVLVEWTRSRLFTWNDFSVTLWQVPVLLQIAAFTGHYGVNFTMALANSSFASFLIYRKKSAAILFALPILFSAAYGYWQIKNPQKTQTVKFSPALIQGNLSQRRRATIEQAQEALDTYVNLTKQVLSKKRKPDVVLWPEGAVPVPYLSGVRLSLAAQKTDYGRLVAMYQYQVRDLCREFGVPLLIGALDFEDVLPGNKNPGSTNSALYFDSWGILRAKYDKLHRVPFGEYIPFRNLMPESIVRFIDMGRDLVPGRNPNPVQLLPQVLSGTAICFEGVFSYVMRNFARRGANVFIVLSNDAWYPRSSEPEQHLANALLRAVECRLPMIRCGNNGGSGIVYPDGSYKILDPSGKARRPELLRCAAAETVDIELPEKPQRTFYVRHGEWFIFMLGIFCLVWTLLALRNRDLKNRFLAKLSGKKILKSSE